MGKHTVLPIRLKSIRFFEPRLLIRLGQERRGRQETFPVPCESDKIHHLVRWPAVKDLQPRSERFHMIVVGSRQAIAQPTSDQGRRQPFRRRVGVEPPPKPRLEPKYQRRYHSADPEQDTLKAEAHVLRNVAKQAAVISDHLGSYDRFVPSESGPPRLIYSQGPTEGGIESLSIRITWH